MLMHTLQEIYFFGCNAALVKFMMLFHEARKEKNTANIRLSLIGILMSGIGSAHVIKSSYDNFIRTTWNKLYNIPGYMTNDGKYVCKRKEIQKPVFYGWICAKEILELFGFMELALLTDALCINTNVPHKQIIYYTICSYSFLRVAVSCGFMPLLPLVYVCDGIIFQ
jgi:hypothetical protein